MPDLICDVFVTLDGFASGSIPAAYFGYRGPELERWMLSELARPQLLLLAGRSYAQLADLAADPSHDDAVIHGLRDLPKAVFSGEPEDRLMWGPTRRLHGHFATRIRELKSEPGPPIRTIGSLKLVRRLLREGFVDRMRLLLFPLTLGATGYGPVFERLPGLAFELLDQRVLDGRVVLLEYRPTTGPQ